jgi:hypothetical protein
MKIYKLYLFGDIIYKTKDILLALAYKETYKKELQKYIIIK